MLYVSANSGVYRSLDNGVTWALFPAANDTTLPNNGAQKDGGFLPSVQVSSLTLVQGEIDPTTGHAVPQPGDPDLLLATTFGRGQFAIRLAPIVFPGTVQLDTKLPAPNGSISGKDAQGNPIVKIPQPVIDGLSEQSAFGNTVYITIVDMTDPTNPRIIGGYDPEQSGDRRSRPIRPARRDRSRSRSIRVPSRRTGSRSSGSMRPTCRGPRGTSSR